VELRNETWFEPPAAGPLLPAMTVHVWRARLDVPPPLLETLAATLAPDERARAARFRRESDRHRYTAGRGILRDLLARYLSVAPEEPVLRYGSHGRPELGGPHADDDLNFNLSHSQALALYAFTRGRELGIDVEAVRHDVAVVALARRFFSPAEAAALEALPESVRTEAFFNGWTRKEAFIKARGDGLSLPLDSFDVTLAPGTPAALLSTGWDPAEAESWSLAELSPAQGFKAALAVTGPPPELCRFRWRLTPPIPPSSGNPQLCR
jgi:4'-phosphopantetheinyl transferase